MNAEYICRNRLRIRNDSTSFLSTPFTGSTANDLHFDSNENASLSPTASGSPTASLHAPLEWEEYGDSIRETNTTLSHSPPNRGSRSSRIRRSPKWRRMGMNNPKKGTFAELHPDGPFSIYFTQQLEQRCSIRSYSSLVQQKKPSLFKPILQNSSLLGVCLHCYTCRSSSSCVPYTPLSKSAHHAIMSSSEFSSSPDHVDITLILAGTYFLPPSRPHRPDRLFLLRYFAARWQGCFLSPSLTRSPLVATIHLPHNRLDAARKLVPSLALPPRFTVILHAVKRKERYFNDFPVNLLRNIAIKNVRTTHFLVTDMDLWPIRKSCVMESEVASAYQRLLRLPKKLLLSNRSAVIVPSIFAAKKERILKKCETLEECAVAWRLVERMRSRSDRFFPKTKAELVSCFDAGKCSMRKEIRDTHVRHAASG